MLFKHSVIIMERTLHCFRGRCDTGKALTRGRTDHFAAVVTHLQFPIQVCITSVSPVCFPNFTFSRRRNIFFLWPWTLADDLDLWPWPTKWHLINEAYKLCTSYTMLMKWKSKKLLVIKQSNIIYHYNTQYLTRNNADLHAVLSQWKFCFPYFI